LVFGDNPDILIGDAVLVLVIAPGVLVIVYLDIETFPVDEENEKLAPVSLILNNDKLVGELGNVVIVTELVEVVTLLVPYATIVNIYKVLEDNPVTLIDVACGNAVP
jgi:hypothetical protein